MKFTTHFILHEAGHLMEAAILTSHDQLSQHNYWVHF